MAKISPQLLDTEYETYIGFKNFLRDKSTSFGQDMNDKYSWNDDKLMQVNDQDAYNHILTNYVVELKEHK
jgi:hypothetical protein